MLTQWQIGSSISSSNQSCTFSVHHEFNNKTGIMCITKYGWVLHTVIGQPTTSTKCVVDYQDKGMTWNWTITTMTTMYVIKLCCQNNIIIIMDRWLAGFININQLCQLTYVHARTSLLILAKILVTLHPKAK